MLPDFREKLVENLISEFDSIIVSNRNFLYELVKKINDNHKDRAL